VSDSKKFGTRDPALTGGPELPEVGPPPPGSASTFYVSGSVFEYLRWLEEIPTERALDTSQGCVAELGRIPAGRRATGWRPSRCGGVRNVRTSTSGHTRTRLSARVPRQRVDSPSRYEAGLATSGATPEQTDCLRRPTRAAGSSRGRPPPAVFGPAALARVLGAPERWGNRRP
jgi:hypothetical protein